MSNVTSFDQLMQISVPASKYSAMKDIKKDDFVSKILEEVQILYGIKYALHF